MRGFRLRSALVELLAEAWDLIVGDVSGGPVYAASLSHRQELSGVIRTTPPFVWYVPFILRTPATGAGTSKPVIFTISAAWDDEASVWRGHCDDIPAAAHTDAGWSAGENLRDGARPVARQSSRRRSGIVVPANHRTARSRARGSADAAQFDRALRDLLQQAGCTVVRQGNGSHEIWYRPITMRIRRPGRHSQPTHGERHPPAVWLPRRF